MLNFLKNNKKNLITAISSYYKVFLYYFNHSPCFMPLSIYYLLSPCISNKSGQEPFIFMADLVPSKDPFLDSAITLNQIVVPVVKYSYGLLPAYMRVHYRKVWIISTNLIPSKSIHHSINSINTIMTYKITYNNLKKELKLNGNGSKYSYNNGSRDNNNINPYGKTKQ